MNQKQRNCLPKKRSTHPQVVLPPLHGLQLRPRIGQLPLQLLLTLCASAAQRVVRLLQLPQLLGLPAAACLSVCSALLGGLQHHREAVGISALKGGRSSQRPGCSAALHSVNSMLAQQARSRLCSRGNAHPDMAGRDRLTRALLGELPFRPRHKWLRHKARPCSRGHKAPCAEQLLITCSSAASRCARCSCCVASAARSAACCSAAARASCCTATSPCRRPTCGGGSTQQGANQARRMQAIAAPAAATATKVPCSRNFLPRMRHLALQLTTLALGCHPAPHTWIGTAMHRTQPKPTSACARPRASSTLPWRSCSAASWPASASRCARSASSSARACAALCCAPSSSWPRRCASAVASCSACCATSVAACAALASALACRGREDAKCRLDAGWVRWCGLVLFPWSPSGGLAAPITHAPGQPSCSTLRGGRPPRPAPHLRHLFRRPIPRLAGRPLRLAGRLLRRAQPLAPLRLRLAVPPL